MTETYTIDASGKTLGRVASEAAVLLCGKDSVKFTRQAPPLRKVAVANTGKMKLVFSERRNKIYHRYSGYPGGLKAISFRELKAKKGMAGPLRQAVSGMLPKNKWRDILLKRLIVIE